MEIPLSLFFGSLCSGSRMENTFLQLHPLPHSAHCLGAGPLRSPPKTFITAHAPQKGQNLPPCSATSSQWGETCCRDQSKEKQVLTEGGADIFWVRNLSQAAHEASAPCTPNLIPPTSPAHEELSEESVSKQPGTGGTEGEDREGRGLLSMPKALPGRALFKNIFTTILLNSLQF